MTAQRACEHCSTVLVPYGASTCWACGQASARGRAPRGAKQRVIEAATLGGGLGAGVTAVFVEADAIAVVGAAAGAAVFAIGALVRGAFVRAPASEPVAPALGANPADDANRLRLHAIEREIVARLDQVAAALRANADAIAARGGSTEALDRASGTLAEVRGRYEANLASTIVAAEMVAVIAWLRRMSAIVALPTVDAEQARAVSAYFDREVAAASTASYGWRAQLTPGPAGMTVVARATCAPFAVAAELASVLAPRLEQAWRRAVEAAATLRGVLVERMEIAAVRAAADVAAGVRPLEPAPQQAAVNVVGSLEAELARLMEESERIGRETEAMRDVESAVGR